MEPTEESQHFLDRLGRVGVVHDNSEWLPGVNPHHSSWNGRRRRQGGDDRIQLDTCPKRDPGRAERIRDVELADERQRACRTTARTSIEDEGAANRRSIEHRVHADRHRPRLRCTG